MANGSQDVKLMGFWASPYLLRVRMALNIKGIPYEFVEKDETVKIPKLLHAGCAICEPFKIVEYLDATWNSIDFPPILSKDPYNRAIGRFWETHIDEKIALAMKSLLNGKKDDVEEEFHAAILILENGLTNDVGREAKSFFGKENIGYIDISLGSMLGWLKAIEKLKKIKLFDAEKTPMLVSWAKRFQAHDAIKGLMPDPMKLSEVLDGTINGGDSKDKEEENEAYFHAMQLVSASVPPMCLKTVIELGVLDILVNSDSKKFLSAKEIADELSIANPDAPIMLDRIFRCLASHNILACKLQSADETSSRLYGASPLSKCFVKNEDGVSFAPGVSLLQDEITMKTLYYLKDSVMTGGMPFDMAHGMSVFNYLGKDARYNKLFNDSMVNHTTLIMRRIINSYNGFENLKTLVDVGGGLGANLNLIVSKYPTIKGINFDLPHVIANAPLIKGVKHVAGDMFQNVPSGDAFFMKYIMHDWSDDHCVKILKNCWKELPENGKVIVAEFILSSELQDNYQCKSKFELDILMMALMEGGKERTEKEFCFLAKKAGFTTFRIACDVGVFCIMEFTK